jgi:23S rRNA (uracil1939-C5)-methyltransferase
VGRLEGFVFLVDGALPGDLVRVRVTRRRPSYAEAETVEVLEPSPQREEPRCGHALECGGCAWMPLSSAGQLAAKRRLVIDALRKVRDLRGVAVAEVLASPRRFGYRNHLDLTFGGEEGSLVLGFHERGRPGRVFRLRECHLAPPLLSEIALEARARLEALGLGPCRPGAEGGFLRQLGLRIDRQEAQVLVNVVTRSGLWPGGEEFARKLRERFPRIVGVVRTASDRRSLGAGGQETTLHGRPYLLETLAGLELEVGVGSFLQVNTRGAEKLYRIALESLGAGPEDRLLDLYCGVGAISLLVGPTVRSTLGVESDRDSVRRADRNARRNGARNVTFERSDARRSLAKVLASGRPFDRVVVNPPRAGLHPTVVERLLRLRPRRIVYISCQPPTLARDLALFGQGGYGVGPVRPVDLFPNTPHVEAVASLTRG